MHDRTRKGQREEQREEQRDEQQNQRTALMFAAAAVVLWSTVATAFKIALDHFEPAGLLLAATAVSAVCFAIVAFMNRDWRLPRNAWPRAMVLGALNPVLYYLVLFAAYDRLPAQIAQPLNYTWVLMLALLSVPLLKQRIDARLATGLVISYVGVVLIITRADFSAAPEFDGTGIGLALTSTVIWALYWILSRRATERALPLLLWSFLFALIPLALLNLPTLISASPMNSDSPGITGWLAAFWIGVVEMGVTFLIWQRAMALSTHTARTGQLVFLSPFLSLIFIATVLGESISPWSVSGLAVIVAGILVSGRG